MPTLVSFGRTRGWRGHEVEGEMRATTYWSRACDFCLQGDWTSRSRPLWARQGQGKWLFTIIHWVASGRRAREKSQSKLEKQVRKARNHTRQYQQTPSRTGGISAQPASRGHEASPAVVAPWRAIRADHMRAGLLCTRGLGVCGYEYSVLVRWVSLLTATCHGYTGVAYGIVEWNRWGGWRWMGRTKRDEKGRWGWRIRSRAQDTPCRPWYYAGGISYVWHHNAARNCRILAKCCLASDGLFRLPPRNIRKADATRLGTGRPYLSYGPGQSEAENKRDKNYDVCRKKQTRTEFCSKGSARDRHRARSEVRISGGLRKDRPQGRTQQALDELNPSLAMSARVSGVAVRLLEFR